MKGKRGIRGGRCGDHKKEKRAAWVWKEERRSRSRGGVRGVRRERRGLGEKSERREEKRAVLAWREEREKLE